MQFHTIDIGKGVKVEIRGPFLGKASVCEPILRALPDWFGIEEATLRYVEEIERLPTWLASASDDVTGFLTLKEHNEFSSEIYVMGVRPEAHRQGIGRALVKTSERYLRQRGAEYLLVKTLGASHPDSNYAKTRAFYLEMEFRPLEELKELWGEDIPCLLMVKSLLRVDDV